MKKVFLKLSILVFVLLASIGLVGCKNKDNLNEIGQNLSNYYIDFKKLKQFYKMGEYKEIPHRAQTTYCYLVDLQLIIAKGALMGITNY